MNVFKSLLIVIVLIAIVVGYVLADWYSTVDASAPRRYVGRAGCADCHQQQSQDFIGSHHDLAMDLATDDSVLGDFSDAKIEHFGIESRMYRDGDRFMINTEGPDGEMGDFEIKYVFGVTPLQQYMVEIQQPTKSDGKAIGRVQVLRVSWDTQNKRWFYLSPPDVDEKLDVGDPLHWTGVTQNWNTSCAECHSTHLQKNYHTATNTFKTTFSEIDVSCEACHGPASLHVQLAQGNSLFWDRKHGKGLVSLKAEKNVTQVQSCAPCHARRGTIKNGFVPGCNFDDYYSLQLLNVPIYHGDGQVREEDYVYGSFLQSKMYHNNVRCSDCHNPHSGNLIHTGNQVCTSCHQHPAGKYDTEAHHHHKPGTEGAACVNCHMPATTYMAVDARRDHSFRVPRPDLSVSVNTPNACTGCHLKLENEDQSQFVHSPNAYLDLVAATERGDSETESILRKIDREMLAAVEKWYPAQTSPPKTPYYSDLALSQSGPSRSGPLQSEQTGEAKNSATLLELARNVRNPAIFRATALDVLATGFVDDDLNAAAERQAKQRDLAIGLLKDSDIKIASAAITVLEFEINDVLQTRPVNPSRAVPDLVRRLRPSTEGLARLLESTDSYRLRIEAARVLAGVPQQLSDRILSSSARSALAKGIEQYKRSFKVNSDRAASHLAAGSFFERQGQFDDAIRAYRTAMSVEPELTGPRSNLAALLDQKADGLRFKIDQLKSRGSTDTRAINRIKTEIDTLLKNTVRLRKEEHQRLARDVKRAQGLPNVSWLHYQYGMSSYLQGDLKTAQLQLELATEKDPENSTHLLGLTTFYIQIKQWEKAQTMVDRLLSIDPNDVRYQQLKRSIEANR